MLHELCLFAFGAFYFRRTFLSSFKCCLIWIFLLLRPSAVSVLVSTLGEGATNVRPLPRVVWPSRVEVDLLGIQFGKISPVAE